MSVTQLNNLATLKIKSGIYIILRNLLKADQRSLHIAYKTDEGWKLFTVNFNVIAPVMSPVMHICESLSDCKKYLKDL